MSQVFYNPIVYTAKKKNLHVPLACDQVGPNGKGGNPNLKSLKDKIREQSEKLNNENKNFMTAGKIVNFKVDSKEIKSG